MDEKEMQELDVWLAENVMEWENRKIYWNWAERDFWFDGDERKISVAKWHPTTSIAQAFEVNQKLDQLLYLMETSKNVWLAYLLDASSEYAETPALAICLAAKKAWETK